MLAFPSVCLGGSQLRLCSIHRPKNQDGLGIFILPFIPFLLLSFFFLILPALTSTTGNAFATANLPAGSQGLQSSTRCKGGGYLSPSASTGCSSPMFLSWKKFGDLQRYSKLEKRGVFSQGCKLSPSKTRLLGWSSWEPPSSPEVKEDDFTY